MSLLPDLSRRLRVLMRGRAETPEPEQSGSANVAAEPALPRGPARFLVTATGSTLPPQRHRIVGQLEIGRDEDGRVAEPGMLLLRDANVSWRHCIVTQTPEGSCFLRDLSRNGTRLDARRLVPNVENEFRVGQTLDLGFGLKFVLEGEPVTAARRGAATRRPTNTVPNMTFATVLVGDIRDYTVLVREAPSVELQQSVSRVFARLTASIEEQGGTIKEFPGDAIIAYWEGGAGGDRVISACRAVIELDRLTQRIATDATVWTLTDHPLMMDWALATGPVVIDSFGGDTPKGLSMVGEPIVLASRLEKFANDKTGRILTCRTTQQLAVKRARAGDAGPLSFVDLGPMHAKGFDRPDHVFALRVPDS